ncbi:MAG: hypothetical protein RRB13_12310 [bacterium]|nr:hypothetical protein [bacterium]
MNYFKLGALLLCLSSFSTSSFAADSASNRKDATLYLGIQPIGMDIPDLIGPTGHLGIGLGENLIFGVEKNQPGALDEAADSSFYYETQGYWLRLFTGNSFYFKLGYHQRKWQFRTSNQGLWLFGNINSLWEDVDGVTRGEAKLASFGFGNLWHFDSHFYLGVDWAVFTKPLSSSYSGDVVSYFGYGSDAEAQRAIEERAKLHHDVMTGPGLAVLTLGFYF